MQDRKLSGVKPAKPNLKKPKIDVSRHEGEAPIPFPREAIYRREANESEGEDRRPSRAKR